MTNEGSVMNIASIIQKEGFQIRTVVENGETLYCAKDICKSLCLGESAHRKKIRALDPDEVTACQVNTPSRGTQTLKFVTEPGLYKMILWSKGAKTTGHPAHRFARWVCHDVLPQIRKTGVYRLEQQLLEVTNELEETTGHLDYVRDELQFVERNRLYKVAFSIQSVRNRGSRAYQFVKQRIHYFHESLEWRENVPFIIRGQENVVRAFLNN
jgi:prophage antirepressor-like protein